MTITAWAEDCWLDTTGDAVVGDVIRFMETVFAGSYRSPRAVGERMIVAIVERDSYGAERQQHTFTLRVVCCEGHAPIPSGCSIRRKGRNIYRNGTQRLNWQDYEARKAAANEKHRRGADARSLREKRIDGEGF